MNIFKKVILLFVVFTFFSTLKASAIPVVCQINGQPVTKRGQLVIFAGTNGCSGMNTPAEHQIDPIDTWLVMQVERGRALLMKQHPIAVQEYKHNEHAIARYDQSDIKASVANWWSMVSGLRLGDFSIQDYVLPVKLNGENKSSVGVDIDFSSPDDIDRSIQSKYKTTVDPSGSVYAFVPSYIDVNAAISGCVDVGEIVWTSFIASPPLPEPPLRESEAAIQERGVIRFTNANYTHLRSPLHAPWYDEESKFGIAAYITSFGFITSGGEGVPMYANLGVRPACWVNIQE